MQEKKKFARNHIIFKFLKIGKYLEQENTPRKPQIPSVGHEAGIRRRRRKKLILFPGKIKLNLHSV